MNNNELSIKRPKSTAGDVQEVETEFDVEPFELYGRRHEIADAQAKAVLTRLSEGVHLDLEVDCRLWTTCDRTLQPTEIELKLFESELVSSPSNRELCIEDWVMDLGRYTGKALPSEVPMQVFAPGTEPLRSGPDEGEIDPRWRALDDLFASEF